MTAHQKNFIAGEWVDGTSITRDINPSNTKDVVGEYAKADKAQTEKAIAAAKAAFPAWARSTPQERFDALTKISVEILARKEELGRLLAREEGKTLPEGIGEVARAGQIFAFFAGEALRLMGEKGASVRPGLDVEITREPVGVAGMITPWNFPIAIPAWKIAPALCYGNAVVFKPAELVPGSAHALSEIIARSGIPAGVFNLVVGSGSVVGQTLLDHPDVAAISFTGGTDDAPPPPLGADGIPELTADPEGTMGIQEKLRVALRNVDRVITENEAGIKDSLLGLENFTNSLSGNGELIAGFIDAADDGISTVDAKLASADKFLKSFGSDKYGGELLPTVISLRELIQSFDKKSGAMIAETRKTLSDVSQSVNAFNEKIAGRGGRR